MTTLETILTEQLERLFVAELQYTSEEEPIVSAEGRDGVLIGNGDGTVTGEKVQGTIRWSFYSGDGAYVFERAGIETLPGQYLGTAYPGGIIETGDGAQIWFDAKGFGLRAYDETQPHLWRLTMGVKFSTNDERYGWLNTALGLLVSDFDETTNKGIWRAYLPWGSG